MFLLKVVDVIGPTFPLPFKIDKMSAKLVHKKYECLRLILTVYSFTYEHACQRYYASAFSCVYRHAIWHAIYIPSSSYCRAV